MSLITINEQIERYAQLQQAMSKAQAQYVTTTGPVFTAMYKEASALVKEMHQAFKNYQKDVNADLERRRKDLAQEQYVLENRLFNDRFRTLLSLTEQLSEMKVGLHEERQGFNDVINSINRQLGEFTHIWGSYIEKCAIDSAQSILIKDFDVLSFASKVKKTIRSEEKPKFQHIEIDFLAANDTTVFMVEAKSTLRQDTFRQVINNLTRLDFFFPEYKNHQKQPIVAYLAEEEGVADMLFKSGVWLMQPKATPENEGKIEFDLLIAS